MKVSHPRLALTLALAIVTPSLFAQLPSIAFNVPPKGQLCGAFQTTAWSCSGGYPITLADNDGAINLSVYSAPLYNGRLNNFIAGYNENLGYAATTSYATGTSSTTGLKYAEFTFVNPGTATVWNDPTQPLPPSYTITMHVEYTTYYSSGGGGRGCGGCGTKWVVQPSSWIAIAAN